MTGLNLITVWLGRQTCIDGNTEGDSPPFQVRMRLTPLRRLLGVKHKTVVVQMDLLGTAVDPD